MPVDFSDIGSVRASRYEEERSVADRLGDAGQGSAVEEDVDDSLEVGDLELDMEERGFEVQVSENDSPSARGPLCAQLDGCIGRPAAVFTTGKQKHHRPFGMEVCVFGAESGRIGHCRRVTGGVGPIYPGGGRGQPDRRTMSGGGGELPY